MKCVGDFQAWLPAVFLAASACAPMSEQVKDSSLGRNGGFEHVRAGLPVNWIVFSPATIPTGSYDLAFDRSDFREGAQSLCFDVRACSPVGGWRSPGLCQELPAEPAASYAIRFWIRSEGCAWAARVGDIDAKSSRYEDIDASAVPQGGWQRVERRFTMPKDRERLRFELSIRSPGRLWLDDVCIERVQGEDGAAER